MRCVTTHMRQLSCCIVSIFRILFWAMWRCDNLFKFFDINVTLDYDGSKAWHGKARHNRHTRPPPPTLYQSPCTRTSVRFSLGLCTQIMQIYGLNIFLFFSLFFYLFFHLDANAELAYIHQRLMNTIHWIKCSVLIRFGLHRWIFNPRLSRRKLSKIKKKLWKLIFLANIRINVVSMVVSNWRNLVYDKKKNDLRIDTLNLELYTQLGSSNIEFILIFISMNSKQN